MAKTVAVLIGSLRKDSINQKFAHVLEKLAEGKLKFQILNIGDLPHYNDDLWANPPKSVVELKDQVAASDAVLAIAPEYNRSYPGIIKNALDWGTRPYGKNVWSGKPAAITGASGGKIGAAVGQAHLRLDMLNDNMIVMHQPELYLQWNADDYGDDYSVKNEETRKFLMGFIDAFAAFIEKHA